MNIERRYIICFCGCLVLKLFCNIFWYLEPKEEMIKLHRENLKELFIIQPMLNNKIIKFSTPDKGNPVGFDFCFKSDEEYNVAYDYYKFFLENKGWEPHKVINNDVLKFKNKTKKGVVMYIGGMKHKRNVINYGITSDSERQYSMSIKEELQNTYRKNNIKIWSKVLK